MSEGYIYIKRLISVLISTTVNSSTIQLCYMIPGFRKLMSGYWQLTIRR